MTTEYYQRPDATTEDFSDGWLGTGDLVRVAADGYISIVDRDNDIIKSGGEWISTIALENALMSHDAVSEATVTGIPPERWQERPLAFVVKASAASVEDDVLAEELRDRIQAEYRNGGRPTRSCSSPRSRRQRRGSSTRRRSVKPAGTTTSRPT